MAVAITFYEFSKDSVSTAQPSAGGHSYQCVIKDSSGVVSPTIGLELPMDTSPSNYNYAYIPLYRRYYFIAEWTWERGLWYASLTVDVMASYKQQIGASTQYVLRSAADFDGSVVDTIYPTTAGISYDATESDPFWVASLQQGRYIIGIINSDSSSIGAVSYYVFTQSEFNALNRALLGEINWINPPPTEEISEELLKALFNPYQYIVSAMWVPFVPNTSGTVSNLQFGWWDLSVSCAKLGAYLYTTDCTLSVPKHPQAGSRGSYLNLSPYSRYTLFIRPFGRIPLDTTQLIDSDEIFCQIWVDCFTGKGTLIVFADVNMDTSMIYQTAMCACPIQLAQISRDYLAMASTAVQSAANVVSSAMQLDIAGSIGAGAAGIESSIRASLPQLQTTGSNGSISDLRGVARLQGEFFPLVGEMRATRGRPLCKSRTISSLPGYNLVANASVKTPSTLTENQEIIRIMESGFYYE